MARKQNKSVKSTKKESSVSINTKKGGKVQKKTPEGKAKKKVESQIKQAVKSQGKQSKIQPKLISHVNIGRRSSRTNSDNTKKSSIPGCQSSTIDKVSSSTKAVTSPRTGKGQSANKRQSNPVEKPENKKRVSATNSQKSNKNETSPTDQTKAGNKMSLRGKKRSYTQLASGDKTEKNNVSKKKKTLDSKDVTSRRNRSIKPTIKGSEWRNTILQKKSTGAKQEITSRKVGTTSLKNKSSAAASKSSANNKKTLPPKSTGTTKTVGKTVAKPSKRLSRGRSLTEKVKKLSPSKNKVKNTTKINSALNKSPKARNTRKKSDAKPGESENNSSKANSLATSIKNKFNSSVSNKRKSKDPALQENVLIAEGILHDILNSVGTPDILPKNKRSEDNVDAKLATTDSQILPVKVLDQDEVYKSKQASDVPPQTVNTSVCENKSNHMFIDEDKLVVVPFDKECKLESNCNKLHKSNSDSYLNVDLEEKKSSDVAKETLSNNKDIDKQNSNNENEMEMEEMELRLSDTSATSVNDDDFASSENNLTVSSNIGKINRSELFSKSSDMLGSVLDSEIKMTEKLTEQETKLSEPLQSEKPTHVNDDFSHSSGTAALCDVIKESSQMDTKKEESSEQDTKKKELSLTKNVPLSLPEISDPVLENSSCVTTSISTVKQSVDENDTGTKETIKVSKEVVENATSFQQENHNNSTVLDVNMQISNDETEVITNKKEEGIAPNIQVNQDEKESSDSKMNLKNSNNKFEEHDKIIEVLTSLNGETNKVENFIPSKIKSDSESNFVVHQDASNDGKNTVSDKKEKAISAMKDNSCVTICHSPSLDKPQTGELCKMNIEESKSVNDNPMTNGDTSIPSEIGSLKSGGTTTPDSISKTQELTALGNTSLLGKSREYKEIKLNDFVVGKVNTNVLDSNLCLESDLVKSKENYIGNTIIANSKSESTTDKDCLENKEVSTGETRSQIETSQNLGNSKTNILKSQELNMDKPRLSEQLPLDSDTSSNNVNESNMSFDAQKIGDDCITVPEKVELSSVNKNSAQQELGHEKTLIPEITSSHHVNSPDSTAVMCEQVSSGVGNSKDKITDGSDSPLKHIESEVFRETPSNVSSVTTEDGSLVSQHDSTVELNLNSGSSTNLTEEVNLVTLGSTSSSSHVEQISMNEKFSSENSQMNKTDSSTNLTDDVKKESLSSSSISSHAEQIAVGKNCSSTSSPNDKNVSLQTSIKSSEISCPTEEIISSSAEMLADAIENKEMSEENLKMEESNQEETTQDSIIVDDTDVESMQCNSETLSNRMSVDEDNPGMEVDSEEIAAASSIGSTIEINMEVS